MDCCAQVPEFYDVMFNSAHAIKGACMQVWHAFETVGLKSAPLKHIFKHKSVSLNS